MAKPATLAAHSPQITADCERVLVTLVRGLGPWKKSIYLVGGLTPRYLVKAKPPAVPAHAGTMDVDVVVELQVLADTDAYSTLEENLKKLGFERGENNKGNKVSWRWQKKADAGETIVLEFLADDPEKSGGKVGPLPSEGNVSALNIPHSSMVFTHYATVDIKAELLDGGGVTTETVRHADIVSYTCLKALAFDDRQERKDAHDLVYCLEHGEGGPESAGAALKSALAGKHGDIVKQAVAILEKRFTDEEGTEGYRKDGPVAVAAFEIDDPEAKDDRVLRQRDVAGIIVRVLKSFA